MNILTTINVNTIHSITAIRTIATINHAIFKALPYFN